MPAPRPFSVRRLISIGLIVMLPLLAFVLAVSVLPVTAAPPVPAAPAVSNQSLIFYDGFDSGNTSGWSSVVPRAPIAGLAVNNAAAIITGTGTNCANPCGLEVNFTGDTVASYVQDGSPAAETTYYAGFWFDPNSVTMTDGTSHQIFRAAGASGTVVTMTLHRVGGNYELAMGVALDSGAVQDTSGIALSDGPHHLGFNWQAASTPGANDGAFRFWLDNVSQMDVSALDTDTKSVNNARLGGVADVDASTTGSSYYDEFVSARTLATTGEMLLIAATDEGNLRSAIANAHSGAIIFFPTDLSGQTITLAGTELTINQDLTIDGSGLDPQVTVSGNNASRVFNLTAGNVTFDRLTIANGNVQTTDCALVGRCGGGIKMQNNNVAVTVTNSLFTNNRADFGGAMFNEGGVLVIHNTTFYGNTANSGSGIVLTESDAPRISVLTVTNSTFYSNTSAFGAGSIFFDGLLATVNNSTFSGNSSTVAGAIYLQRGALNIQNNIMANSIGGFSDCYADPLESPVVNLDVNNLIEANSGCGTPAETGDPVLGPLQDNGGDTWTMAILPGSPAIDGGDNATCTTADQRGVARHDGRDQGVICDIGAYEGGSMLCNASAMGVPFTFTYPDQSNLQLTFTEATPNYNADCYYVDEVPVNHPQATGDTNGNNLRTGRYWEIAVYDGDRGYVPADPKFFTATLSIPHDNLPNPKICKYPGSMGGFGWDCFAPTISTTSWLTLTDIHSFSQWAAAANVGPTAVSLQTFTANPILPVALVGGSLLLLFGFGVWVRRKNNEL